MTMQRKHYNAIAAALRSGDAHPSLIRNISQDLGMDNPKFDKDKFTYKADRGPTMEQRAAKYRTRLKRIQRWQEQRT